MDTTLLTLTTSTGPNGSIDPAPGVHDYARGVSVTVTATPTSDHGVAAWSGDCSGTETTCLLTMTANKTANVTFERRTYSLTTSGTGGGSVAPAGTTAHAVNAAVTVTATWAATTHTFDGWGGDCSGTAATCSLTMDADKTVTAMFSTVPLACESGTAVPNPGANGALVRDCEVLLQLRDVLAGTGTLDWTAGTAMTSWTGVTVGGTPQRVTKLRLVNRGLTGELSGSLGTLTALTEVRLNGNLLTGMIPSKLAQLENLTHIYLRGTAFTGCIPFALWDATHHDIAALGLDTCIEPTDVSYGAHTLGAGTYQFALADDEPPLIFDLPAGMSLEIVGIVISDSAPAGPSFIGLILEDASSGTSWICLDIEQNEECGRRIVTGGQAQARSSDATPNIGSTFDRIAESLWTGDAP